MFARLARRRFEVALRGTGSPKPSAGGRKAKPSRGLPASAAAKKRGAADDADEDEAGVRNGAGGKKPKVNAVDLSDCEDE